MSKIKLEIKGMHCRSCEILLERSIGAVPGVHKVRVNHKQGIADIEYGELDKAAIERAVIQTGYGIGREDTKHFFSRNPEDYVELAAIGIVLLNGYLILKKTGVLDYNLNISSTPGLAGVFMIGLIAGVSTCMALIGGLVLGISSRHAEIHPEATSMEKFRPHLYFNMGRLISYAVLGGFIGLAGSALKLSQTFLGVLTIILGFVMLLLGLKLIAIFPRLHNKGVTLPSSILKFFGLNQNNKEYSHGGSFMTGALTFFMPCSFTQAMQLLAISSGSFSKGALIMGLFALGTLPGIIGIGGLTSLIKGKFSKYFFKTAGVVVLLLAVLSIKSGYVLANFGSIDLSLLQSKNEQNEQVNPVDGKQVVEMTQYGGGYSPNKFIVKKGIPVVWKIRSESQYSCAAYISMQSEGIAQRLKLGENIIEFTPQKTGTYRFTCAMGMYSGVFKVIN